MDAEMPHQDDVVQQGPPLDSETLSLSQHEWLQFEPASAVVMRWRRILRMSMGTPRCINWGVLADCGEADRARAILGEDTPWTRLFDLAELLVRVEEDAELPLDIEFSLGGQHFEMSIEQLAVHLGIYYEPETILDDFGQGLTQGEKGVMRAWWAQISDTPFTGHRVRATMIKDPLIRYLHRCIVTTISVIARRPCNLARCFALYYASLYHRQEHGTLWGGAFVTHIARTRGMVDMLDDLATIEPRKLYRRMIISMKLAADIPGLGLRPFQPAQVAIVSDQQQQQQDDGPMPEPEPIREPVQSLPRGEEEPPQHPPHVYRAVRLTEPLEALLHQIAAWCDQMAESDCRRAAWEARVERRLDRYEDLVQWTVASEHARRDGSQLPPFPEPRVYADDGSSAGPSGS
ncbi:hypothetical protein R6Q57_024022 [Mikania cordata]